VKAAHAADSVGWKIVKQLGEGRQADVSLAVRQAAPDGPQYVFKLLNERSSEASRQRIRQELQVISSLNHPGLVRVIEHALQDTGIQYYVVEYVAGLESLRKRMTRNTNPFFKDPLRAIDGFIQLVSALHASEKRRVVHRDLSPANVLVADDSTVKPIDFGLSQIDNGETIALTEEAVGTLHYRAPECSGHSMVEPDIRADLYSTGKLL
jgi:eukaryotic-like serine/threonine-protein kinase